ncbi:hypothetical protein MJO28_016133 [Puccinia striiformis f. sp. tritici]|uniref:Uncharacterized protein n=2 Tax=Puccinia striiformis f. sp. tritici TaxID=168172 RepID=A0A0L0W201_9BASI|nr:hypothetical protein MJO28_016133 [Puccinia striiformis f. sp. tritici]KAI9624680.1 hypothetical protein H4Q26_016744 [Puccinia striiformis f. sp. tritici PST-130]KNF05526.1 hypothetical protein PSTG_01338 [Puccinia striiformis f. sp. tritici PST-78]
MSQASQPIPSPALACHFAGGGQILCSALATQVTETAATCETPQNSRPAPTNQALAAALPSKTGKNDIPYYHNTTKRPAQVYQ